MRLIDTPDPTYDLGLSPLRNELILILDVFRQALANQTNDACALYSVPYEHKSCTLCTEAL